MRQDARIIQVSLAVDLVTQTYRLLAVDIFGLPDTRTLALMLRMFW